MPLRVLKTSLILALFLFQAATASAQQSVVASDNDRAMFSEALGSYRSFNYEQAEKLFEEIGHLPEAQLYRAYSLFAMNRFDDATEVFTTARSLPFTDISQEATYGLAMLYLSSRRFGRGMSLLAELEQTYEPSLQERSQNMLSDYAGFLTFNQRMLALDESENDVIRRLLVRSGLNLHSEEENRELIDRARRLGLSPDFISEMRVLNEEIMDDRRLSSNSDDEESNTPRLTEYNVPDDFSYRVGIMLPQQDRDEDGFEVSRALYYGILLAIEEHNAVEGNNNIELILLNPDLEVDATEENTEEPDFKDLVDTFLEQYRPDIIFGPLFSGDARILAESARMYEIPVLAPLANTENLTVNNPWFFHANPTFSERGRRMAEIATQYLGLRRISVLVDNTTLGMEEARAFRQRAIELGAEIPYYFSEDLQAQRFELSRYSQYFTGNPDLLDKDDDELEEFLENWKRSDALYMPLAGNSAPTVIDLMLTQLLALQSDVQILGSQEFGLTTINRQAARRFNIVYSEVFYRDNESEAVRNFSDDYRATYGRDPDLFGFIGYDNGSFLASVLKLAANPEQTRIALHAHETYQGIGQRFDFRQNQINSAILPIQYQDNRFRILQLPDEPLFDFLKLAEAEDEIMMRLDSLMESYQMEDILDLYDEYRNDGLRLSEEFEELFELFKLFQDDELRVFMESQEAE